MKIKELIPSNAKYVIKSIWFRVTASTKKDWFDKDVSVKVAIDRNIERFAPAMISMGGGKSELHRLKCDMLHCYRKWLISPSEYFLFGFKENTSYQFRKNFIADEVMYMKLMEKEGWYLNSRDLNDKSNFYKLTCDFFKREVIDLDDYRSFCVFCKKHPCVFIKPIDGLRGQGIQKFEYQDEEQVRTKYESLKENASRYIVEEKVIQSKCMSEWNASSVNTVRVPSFLGKNSFEVLGTVLRTGRKGSIVDNGAQGGVMAAIDPKTGNIISDGYDESGNVYPSHPDSQKIFKGVQIPEWKELLSIVETLHKSMPLGHTYIGWDFAHTDDKGWVLIEGNWGQLLTQIATKIGVKDAFFKYFR